MKNIFIISFFLSLSLMFTYKCFAEWTKVGRNVNGTIFYVDFEKIKKDSEFVYYWRMADYSKRTKLGDLSSIVYFKLDCKLFRYKYLSDFYYTQPKGQGKLSHSSNIPDKKWSYDPPNSLGRNTAEIVCKH